MKLLIFSTVYYPDVIGGGEFSTKLIAEGLIAKRYEVEVHTLGLSNSTEIINGVHIIRHYFKNLSEEFLKRTKNNHIINGGLKSRKKILNKYVDIAYSRKWYDFYKNIIKKSSPDFVHSVSPLSYMGRYNCWKAAYDMNIPVSHVARSPDLIEFAFGNGFFNQFYQKLNARAANYLSALAAPSKYMLKCHIDCNIKADICKVIYNAINIPILDGEALNYKNKQDIVLYAGDIRKEKGILTLYNAICNKKSFFKLVCIGDGELSEELNKRKNIEIIEWMEQSELYKYMRKAKIVVLPSEWNEAFGRILIEAIANGTLAVGSDCGGIPEVLNFDNRYIFQHGNEEELYQKIERIYHLNEIEYLKEVKEQQSWLVMFQEETYIDNWEMFFLDQINKRAIK